MVGDGGGYELLICIMVPVDKLMEATPVTKPGADYSTLRPEERVVLQFIDGNKKLKDIVALCAGGQSEALGVVLGMTLRKLIGFKEYTLAQIKGESKPAAPKPQPPPRPAPPQKPAQPTPQAPRSPSGDAWSEMEERPSGPSLDDDDDKFEMAAEAEPAASPPRAAPQPPPRKSKGPRLIPPLIDRTDAQEDLSTLAMSGSLAEKAYPKLLADLYAGKETGIMRIYRRKGGPHKQVYFRSGRPICIRGDYIIERECLGQLLKFSHKISDWDLNHSLKIMGETKQFQGEVFVREGILSKQTLQSALKWQAELKLAEIFTWKPAEGYYEFYNVGTFKLDITPLELDVPSLLLKGVKRGFPAQIIEAALKPNMDMYVVKKTKAPFSPEDFRLQLPEQRLWEEVIDGDKTLKEVIAEARMDPNQVKRLAYIFEITEMVEFRDRPAGGTDEDKMIEDLKDRLRLSQKGNLFDALGIYWGAVGHTVEAGWRKIQKEYGPQSKIRRNKHPQIEKMCDQIVDLAKKAYDKLIDNQARIEYRNSIFNETKLQLSAELAYQQAESQLLWKEDYRGALANLEIAAELQPRNYVIRAAHGMALIKRFYPAEPERYREGEKIIKTALNVGSNNDMVHFYAGHAYWSMGRASSARSEFEMAARLNPNNHDARKALRALNK